MFDLMYPALKSALKVRDLFGKW